MGSLYLTCSNYTIRISKKLGGNEYGEASFLQSNNCYFCNLVCSVGGSGYWYALVFLPIVPNVLWLNASSAVFHGIAFAAGVVMGFFGIS